MTTTFRKREKEKARQERAKEKSDERARRKTDKPVRVPGEEDPDLAGIVPGPQPPMED